jgi:hypothetical protein
MHALTPNTHFINHLPLNQPFLVVTQNRHLDANRLCSLPYSTLCGLFFRPPFSRCKKCPYTWTPLQMPNIHIKHKPLIIKYESKVVIVNRHFELLRDQFRMAINNQRLGLALDHQ